MARPEQQDRPARVAVRGGATPEELAAVVAVLRRPAAGQPPEDGYARWRRIRLAALRRDVGADRRPA